MVDSPCVKKCTLSKGSCLGCKRTLDEISNWRSMTDAEKTEVVNRVSTITWPDISFPPINLWVLHSARYNNFKE